MSLDVIRCTSDEFLSLTPEVGQIVCVQDNDAEPARLMMWSGTEWNDIKADANSEIQMTAYDINKQIISQLPTLSDEEIEEKKAMILDFCDQTRNVYYMLLCRDINYFTLCHRTWEPTDAHTARSYTDTNELISISDLVIECIGGLGEVKSIELVEGAIEIWFTNPNYEEGTYVMYFFPYDGGVEACQ